MGTPASGKSLEVVELRGFCYVVPNAFTEKNMLPPYFNIQYLFHRVKSRKYSL